MNVFGVRLPAYFDAVKILSMNIVLVVLHVLCMCERVFTRVHTLYVLSGAMKIHWSPTGHTIATKAISYMTWSTMDGTDRFNLVSLISRP